MNVIKGYKFAYASPEEEKETMDKAKAFTSKLKEKGARTGSRNRVRNKTNGTVHH